MAKPLEKCPHMSYRCPHYIDDCEDKSNRSCVHVINTVGIAAGTMMQASMLRGSELPPALVTALQRARQLVEEGAGIELPRGEHR